MASATEPASRHGWLDAMCDRFARVLAGKFAAAHLAGAYGPLPERGAVIVPPSWLWRPASAAVGRKGLAADGGRLLLPLRVNWLDGAVLVLAEDQSVQAAWTSVGVSHSGLGETLITASAAGGVNQVSADLVPAVLHATSKSQAQIVVALKALVADGKAAHWEALKHLEPYVLRACHRAAAVAAYELAADDPAYIAPVMDELRIEALCTQMLLGQEGSAGNGAVHRLLERCTAPQTFAKVDPLRYVVITLRRDAEDAVRREIRDPRIGSKIRALKRELQPANPAELIAAYNLRYPADRLAAGRTEKALMAHECSPELISFADPRFREDTTMGHPSHEDEVIERVDAERAARQARLEALVPAPRKATTLKVAA